MTDSYTTLTIADVAKALRCHHSTIYRLLKRNAIGGAFKLGSDWRFNASTFYAWLDAQSARKVA